MTRRVRLSTFLSALAQPPRVYRTPLATCRVARWVLGVWSGELPVMASTAPIALA